MVGRMAIVAVGKIAIAATGALAFHAGGGMHATRGERWSRTHRNQLD